MLLKRMQPALELFEELDMDELADMMTHATAENYVIIAGIVETYLGLDLLNPASVKDVDDAQKKGIKAAWAKNKTRIREQIFQKIGETVSGSSVYDASFKKFFGQLTMFLVCFSCVYITAVTFIPIPAANQRLADTALGFVIGSIVSPIMGYFFVSTSKNLKGGKSPEKKEDQKTGK